MSNGFSIAISVYLITTGAAGYERYMLQGQQTSALIDSGLAVAGCIWLGCTLQRIIK